MPVKGLLIIFRTRLDSTIKKCYSTRYLLKLFLDVNIKQQKKDSSVVYLNALDLLDLSSLW